MIEKISDPKLEDVIIGSTILDVSAYSEIASIVTEDSFSLDINKRIWKAIVDLSLKPEPIDIITVTNRLKLNKDLDMIGGAYYISSLSNRIVSSNNITFHARILKQFEIKRKLYMMAQKITSMVIDEETDALELLEEVGDEVLQISGEISSGSGGKTTGELVEEVIQITEIARGEKGMTGIDTSYTDLNTILGGYQKSDLIIIGGRPAMGKTSFVVSSFGKCGRPGLFISAEMSDLQLTRRRMSAETGESFSDIQRGRISNMEDWKDRLSGMMTDDGFYIEEVNKLSEITALAHKYKMTKKIEWLVVDYLQLLSAFVKGGNREQEISAISRTLKSLAKQLDIPVVAISQLSRSVETRGGEKKPLLSDLRESGSLEQDADIVIFMYRPEYYNITEVEIRGTTTDSHGAAYAMIAKHRNGATGDVLLKFNDKLTEFSDYVYPYDEFNFNN